MRSRRRILLGTQNLGKVQELRSLLAPEFEVIGLGDLGISLPSVEERGTTYFENALTKAVAYQKLTGDPVVADDSGLEVDALGGAPGVYSADYGGVGISWADRWSHLWAELKAFPETTWTARFRCVLCYLAPGEVPVFFQGVTHGRVLPMAQGTEGFGYDPVIFSDALGKSFGEATHVEKNRVSHRAIAFQQLRLWLDRQGLRG
jgi:non-canonical purine NTP pyrophosphatase (RdgB/HAM1 family)